MKHLFTLLLIICFSNVQADNYYKAKILLLNGQTLEGFAQLPSNEIFDNSIRFKSGESQKSEKIKHKEIDKALYITDGGHQYLLVRKNVRRISRSFGKVREYTTKKEAWLLVRSQHSKINYYYFAKSYFINKEETMIARNVDRSGTWADILLLLKRPHEDAPTIITSFSYGAEIIGKESKFRKYAAIYFSEHKPLVERIEQKEFKHDNMPELIEAYVALEKS